MESVAQRPHNDRRVIGLLCSGHFLSHFYFLALPPMFPLLKAEFGVSYIELGLAITAYNLLGGFAQAPVGFLVDRFGPRAMLLAGLGLNASAILLIGFADAYWVLLVLAVFAGLGNSVFHPADYAIMSGSIREEKMGRAFSVHTFSGFLGGACAPVAMLTLASLTDWRTAFIAIGMAGLVVWAFMALWSGVLIGENQATPAQNSGGGTPEHSGMRLLMTPPVLMFLGFFVAYGMASGGLSAFTVIGLINLQGVSLDLANMALTGHLFGVVGGVVLSGFIVDRFRRHGVTAAIALLVAVGFVLLPALLGLPALALVAIMTIVGLGMGAVLPPRDLMIRAMTPPGQSGKVFGFVFVGYAVGASLTPLFFGWLLDQGSPSLVFILSAVFLVAALAAITVARRLASRLPEYTER
jgi:MFS family permease